MCHLILLVPDHFLSFFFSKTDLKYVITLILFQYTVVKQKNFS